MRTSTALTRAVAPFTLNAATPSPAVVACNRLKFDASKPTKSISVTFPPATVAAIDGGENSNPAREGLILKGKSPSCGLSEVPVWENNHSEKVLGSRPGLFALALTNEFSDLPKVQEEDLTTPEQVQDFVERMVQYVAMKRAPESL